MSTAEDRSHDALADSLRKLRPEGPGSESLEQRLAIASILAATGVTSERPQLGRLEVQSRLGGGGMGVVYRAYDPGLGRWVAVKLLRGWMERAQRELIAEEARSLAQLSHPHVVTVHEIVDEGDEVYFVMEYVAGVTLREWLDTHPRAGWREVVEWFVQAGKGLSAAHGKGIVHRDFKPENVLVGEDGRVRVVDFGLARPFLEVEAELAGTLYYMAPELQASGAATPASDQYAFCRSLSDALEGKGAPQALTQALERGLAEEPHARHPSLEGLVETLGASLQTGSKRSRALLLKRVERLWLQGVLERSLGDEGAVELELTSKPGLVDSPWESWGVEGELSVNSSRQLGEVLQESHGSLLIVGSPGGGKTTLLLLLCRELWRASSLSSEAPAPAVLSLSTYQPPDKGDKLGDHFSAWVVDELVAKYGLPRPAAGQWLEEAGLALLLDGLDETPPHRRDRVVQALNTFREKHPAPIVVTCRDSEYEAISDKLCFGGAVQVQPMGDTAIARLVETRRAPQLMAQLARDEELREMLRNPLLLTLYATSPSDADVTAGSGWAAAYERYVEHAFSDVAETERRRLEERLGYLARVMRRLSISDLWLERLHFGWLEGKIDRVVGFGLGVIAVLLFGVGLNLAQVPITGDPPASALTFGLGVSITSFAYTRGRIKPVERLRWSWRRALRLLPITTVCATIVGLAEALRVNFAANITGAGITGAILAVTFALESGDQATRVRPNAGIRRSGLYALGVSLGFGIPVGLLFGLVINPYITRPLIEVQEHAGNPAAVVGTAVGLFVFTALFLIYGGFTVIMHWVLRFWLSWRTPLPLRLVRLLDRAVELGLMRQVGGGYVFLHRTLLDFFADRTEGSRRAPG